MQRECPCYWCGNYKGKMKCRAYPDGIPEAIRLGGNQHVKEFKGDKGITFTEAKKPKFK